MDEYTDPTGPAGEYRPVCDAPAAADKGSMHESGAPNGATRGDQHAQGGAR